MRRRFLFISPSWPGEVLPLLPVAAKLIEGGHEVGWLFTKGPERSLSWLPVSVVGSWHHHRPNYEPASQEFWQAYLDLQTDLVPRIRSVIRRFDPDLIVGEGSYDSSMAARLERRPFACLYPYLFPLAPPGLRCELFDLLAGLREEGPSAVRRREYEQELRQVGRIPDVNVMFTTREFAGSLPVADRLELLGPSLGGALIPREGATFPWSAIHSNRPLVVIAFGTRRLATRDLIERVVGAVPAGCQLVLQLLPEFSSLRVPSDAIVSEHIPQLELLSRADVFVSHCGANSVMEAAFHGVPILGLPLASDQPVNAYLVERAGIGTHLDPMEATQDRIRDCIESLLSPSPVLKERLASVCTSYSSADAPGRTAKLLVFRSEWRARD